MPNKHDDLSDEQLEQVSLSVDHGDQVARPVQAAFKSPWWLKTSLALMVLACLAMCAWIYYLQTSLSLNQQSLLEAQARIENLQQRLSTTDENMSDSSLAMQLHIKELKEKTEQLWQQMDKLWASAWRRNQKEIGGMSDSISKLERDQQGLQKQLKQQGQKLGSKQQSIVTGLGKLERGQKQAANKREVLRQDLAAQGESLKSLTAAQQQLKQSQKDKQAQQKQAQSTQAKQITQLEQQIEQLSYSLRQLQQKAAGAAQENSLETSTETGIQAN